MIARSKICTLALALLFCAVSDVLPALPQYQRTAYALKTGVQSGWTYRPEETSAAINQAVLLVPDPQKSGYGGSYIVFLHGGQGMFGSGVQESYSEPIGAVKADVNGDGLGDVLVWFRNRSMFRVLYGGNSISAAQPIQTYEDTLRLGSPDTLAAADLNGDGKQEILAWYPGLENLLILWQETTPAGSDLFRRYDLYPLRPNTSDPALSGNRMLFGDFDGDGYRDIIFQGYIFRGGPSGKFRSRTLIAADSPYSALLGAEDIDSDGVSEILLARKKTSPAATVVLEAAGWDSTSGLRSRSAFSTGLAELAGVRLGDYTNDGVSDLLLIGRNALTVLPGAGNAISAGPADTLLAWTRDQRFLGAADWGQDGILDWLFLTAVRDSIAVYIPQAARYIDNTAGVGLARKMAGNAAAVGDYNNDGRLDVYVQNGKGFNALFESRAGGGFVDVAATAGVSLANDGISCAWGDYDNDGFLDLFVAGMSLPSKLFHNNGNGTFSDSSAAIGLDRAGQRAASVAWGDVDRDGWLDLLIGNLDGPNWLLINQGGRRFADRSKALGLTESFMTESAVLVDVDNDGWLDMVSLNSDGPIRLLKGSDTGFTDITAASGFNPDQSYKKFGQSQAWGDFNSDGYPDLYITRAQDVDALYMNNGPNAATRFERKFSDYIDGRYGRLAAAIADLDEDKAPDLLIARVSFYGSFPSRATDRFFPGVVTGYPYLGGGFQPLNRINLGLERTIDSSLPLPADYDGDGDLDVLFVNYLPDNPSDLFHGSALPLGYLENRGSFLRNLSICLKREQNRSLIGTRVFLYSYGLARLQTVSGGGGRIQANGPLIYSLGSNPVDSLVVYWPQGGRQVYRGMFAAGAFELTEDSRGPTVTAVPTPEQQPLKGEISSTSDLIPINLDVRDSSAVSWVRAVNLKSATTRADTLYGASLGNGLYRQPRHCPGPQDSLYYLIEAADIFGNVSRYPSSGFYKLVNLSQKFIGDINADKKVDINDLLRLLELINKNGQPATPAELSAADLNHDGKVDTLDLIRLLALIGAGAASTSPSGTVGTIPPTGP